MEKNKKKTKWLLFAVILVLLVWPLLGALDSLTQSKGWLDFRLAILGAFDSTRSMASVSGVGRVSTSLAGTTTAGAKSLFLPKSSVSGVGSTVAPVLTTGIVLSSATAPASVTAPTSITATASATALASVSVSPVNSPVGFQALAPGFGGGFGAGVVGGLESGLGGGLDASNPTETSQTGGSSFLDEITCPIIK